MSQPTTEDKLLSALSHKKTANLTAEERKALLLKQLDKQKRGTLTDFHMGKIKSWLDFTNLAGIVVPPDIASGEVNYTNVKLVFDRQIELAKSGELILEQPKPPTKVEEDDAAKLAEAEDEFSVISCLRNNPEVIYNKHQEKAASTLVRNLMKHKHRGNALNCRVGGGKTFILAAMLRELWERNWEPLMKSIALYPVLYITRASVVQQTERVLFNKFGLRPGHHVIVTNIDQLRATFGKNFIKEEINVVGGIEYTTYVWYPFLSPVLIILDESQSVKNPDSTQSEMMQAYNELPDSHLICSSATLFTRVIEAKVMAVSTRMEW